MVENLRGVLQKMDVLVDRPVRYLLSMEDRLCDMSALVGLPLHVRHTGAIYCAICGTKIRKTFQEGLCFRCFQNAPQASPCIFHPELCRAHLGEGRDLQWEEEHHNRPHVVYLALSSAVKVGVTRSTQVPYRWIDQGANAAIRIAQTPNRYQAGCMEVLLKNYFADKTNWQRMLKNQIDSASNLKHEQQRVFEFLSVDQRSFFLENEEIIEIEYPVIRYPETIKSISFDKQAEIQQTLIGIKGQYLIFDNGGVFNVRKHTGYEVELSVVERA